MLSPRAILFMCIPLLHQSADPHCHNCETMTASCLMPICVNIVGLSRYVQYLCWQSNTQTIPWSVLNCTVYSACVPITQRRSPRSESSLYVVITIKLGMFPPEVCSWHDLHKYYSWWISPVNKANILMSSQTGMVQSDKVWDAGI